MIKEPDPKILADQLEDLTIKNPVFDTNGEISISCPQIEWIKIIEALRKMKT